MKLRSAASTTARPVARRDRETTEKGKEKREATAVCPQHEAHFNILDRRRRRMPSFYHFSLTVSPSSNIMQRLISRSTASFFFSFFKMNPYISINNVLFRG